MPFTCYLCFNSEKVECYYFTVFKKCFNMKVQMEVVDGLVSLRQLQLRYQ